MEKWISVIDKKDSNLRKMNVSKGIIYNDGSCREIKNCTECGGFEMIDEGTGIFHICYELYKKLNCKKTDKIIRILTPQYILKNCPLYDYVYIKRFKSIK